MLSCANIQSRIYVNILGMWSTFFKILLCITLCVICIIIIYNINKKEGFQTVPASGEPPDVEIAIGTYGGSDQPVSITGAVNPVVSIDKGDDIISKSILFQLTGELKYYAYNTPVEIYTYTGSVTGASAVASGFLFIYNFPNLAVHKNEGDTAVWTVSSAGIKWAATGQLYPPSTQYMIKAKFCKMITNGGDERCNKDSSETFAKETPVEMDIYDNYELYNFNTPPTPVTTQMKQHNMASELTAFDSGAPTPWDYDNRAYDPADILWGNVHPTVSQSIFSTAYARDMLKSINNLNWDPQTSWTYTSVLFERTWSGDDERFLPGIQFAEFIVNTGFSMLIPMPIENAYEGIMDTKWGRGKQQILNNIDAARGAEKGLYNAMVQNGASRAEAKRFSQLYGNKYFNELQELSKLSPEDQAICREAREAELNRLAKGDLVDLPEGTSADDLRKRQAQIDANRRIPANIIAANDVQFGKMKDIIDAEALNKAKPAVISPNASDAAKADADAKVAANRQSVKNAGQRVERTALNRFTQAVVTQDKYLSKGVAQKGISSIMLKVFGEKMAKKLNSITAAKVASKLAQGVGATIGGGKVLYAFALAMCGAPTAGTGMAVCGPIVTAINIFLDLFVISCVSWIPAILDTYIPSDSVCRPGWFNIEDAMNALPGGAIGWLIVTSVPGLGDGLGTFGPYLCSEITPSKTLGRVELKKPRVTPGYFFDSTLSLYCDINKTAMSPEIPQFKDRRMYTENARTGADVLKAPYWSYQRIAPIWVDYSDKRILDKMASFYYMYARRLAIDNYDGTFTFQYISKFYGVVASSEFSCDVQCEITQVTYYSSTGDIQSKFVVMLDPYSGTGATHHDRRFYFYPIQVPVFPIPPARIPKPSAPTETIPNPAYADYISARNIENYYKDNIYKAISYTFLTYQERNQYVGEENNINLNKLMTDNVMRYVVTACTNMNGTAPNTREVDGEGEYVGDAIISLGDTNVTYYPPQLSMNSSYISALTFAVSQPIDLTGVTTATFYYTNPRMVFANGDTVVGIHIPDTIDGKQTVINNILQTSVIAKSITKTDDNSFSGTVTSYTEGSVVISIPGLKPSGVKRYSIRVETRSDATKPGMNDNGCSEMRAAAFNNYSVPKTPSLSDEYESKTYAITLPSATGEPWVPVVNSASGSATYNTSQKIWNESYGGEVMSQSAIRNSILQKTATGYIGFRVSFRGFPVGALITGGIMPTNFKPGWTIDGLLSCTYQDMMKNTGAYVMNGQITETQIGINNQYLYVNRGPIIRFAPGYTPIINTKIINLLQGDCIDRLAIRKAVFRTNELNTDKLVTKVLAIETDTQNKQCLYTFESQGYNRDTNTLDNVITKPLLLVKYKYAKSSDPLNSVNHPDLALIKDSTKIEYLQPNGTITGDITFNTSVTSTDFANISPELMSTRDDFVKISETVVSSETTYRKNDIIFNEVESPYNISRKGNRLNNGSFQAMYTCANSNVQNRLITQFNINNNNSPKISAITNTYTPNSGSIMNSNAICVYSTTIVTANGIRNNYGISMTLTPAKDEKFALYDLAYDDYPRVYTYDLIPKPGRWINIPPPPFPATSILRDNCATSAMSTCAHPSIIKNLVNQFNKQVVNGKIMKVRKAYTPLVRGPPPTASGTAPILKVCDYQVEMLRTVNATSTLIQKESIRLNIKESTTDQCLWDLNFTGSDVPPADSGHSLTNSKAVPLLSNVYIWAPELLTSVTNNINAALLNYLNVDIQGILSNVGLSLNKEAVSLYETVTTSQFIYSPLPTCKKKCKDPEIVQAIINQYYVDNYPTRQYGVSRRRMEEVRRVGTYDSNTCQVEFIEREDSYANYISSPIFTADPTSSNAKFNTRYYLRQYQFNTLHDLNVQVCAHNISSIAEVVSTGNFSLIDLDGQSLVGGKAIAIQSDSSVITKAENASFNYSNIEVDCTNPNILDAVKQQYDKSYPFPVPAGTPTINSVLTAISTAFNRKANICEYNIVITKPFRSSITRELYTLADVQVTIEAQWGTYTPRTGINYQGVLTPTITQYDPATIRGVVQSDSSYLFYDSMNNPKTLPFTYQLPTNYNSNVVKTIKKAFL